LEQRRRKGRREKKGGKGERTRRGRRIGGKEGRGKGRRKEEDILFLR
jgi:hypothetical protein